jgi:hypothetical protein
MPDQPAPLSDALADKLRVELKVDELPEEFRNAIAAGLHYYVKVRDVFREGARRPRARRAHYDVLGGLVVEWSKRGNPHSARWVLRDHVFDALSNLGINVYRCGRRSSVARVMALVLEEADRLDGRPAKLRDEFKIAQWREWLAQYADYDD